MSGLLDEAFRVLIREVVREEVREALRDDAPGRAASPTSTSGYLTVAEAASLARVDEATIRSWIRRGKLGTYLAGRVYRVKQEELDAYLSRQGQPAPTTNLRQRAREFLAKRGASEK